MKRAFLTFNNVVIETLLALSSDEQSKGLMFVDPPTPVMSFIYDKPKINKFWMKNTYAKLDIVFCCNGIVTEICCGEPLSTKAVGSNLYSDMVIEFPFGTINKLGITVGSRIALTH